MSGTIRIERDGDWDADAWTAVSNKLVRAAEISWEARGVYTWLISHSKTFVLTAETLVAAGPSGRNRARDILRELEQHGWLSRRQERSAGGRVEGLVYVMHNHPIPENERTWTPSQAQPRRKPSDYAVPAPVRPGAGDDATTVSENRSSEPAPVRAGAGEPAPDHPAPGRTGASRARCSFPLEEQEEKQGGVSVDPSSHLGAKPPTPNDDQSTNNPPPDPRVVPAAGACPRHRAQVVADPTFDPPCHGCRKTKDDAQAVFDAWALAEQRREVAAVRAAKVAEVERDWAEINAARRRPRSPEAQRMWEATYAKVSKSTPPPSSNRGRPRKPWVDDGSPRPARADKIDAQVKRGVA